MEPLLNSERVPIMDIMPPALRREALIVSPRRRTLGVLPEGRLTAGLSARGMGRS